MLGARRDVIRMCPQRRHHGVAGAQRVLAEFRDAEIGRLAGDRDVGDEEADLRRIDLEPRRLDIDDEVGRGDFALLDPADEVLDAGGDAGPRLAALLIADEGEGDVACKARCPPCRAARAPRARRRCRPSGRRRRDPRPARR